MGSTLSSACFISHAILRYEKWPFTPLRSRAKADLTGLIRADDYPAVSEQGREREGSFRVADR